MKRSAFLAFIISSTFIAAAAYDFAARNADGATIYYNVSGAEAQVTYQRRFSPTESYSGDLAIPSSVTHEGVTYAVTSIGRHAFFDSPAESVSMPQSIISIDDFAFAGCRFLSSVRLPASLTSLGTNIFDGCFSLSDIDVDGRNPLLRSVEGVVYDKSGTRLIMYPQGRDSEAHIITATETIGALAFYGCTFLSGVTIPDGIRHIGDNAFYFCNGIERIDLPASVVTIGNTAFSDCLNLTEINVNKDNPSYTSIHGSLLDKEARTLIQSPAARTGSSAIPESVTHISDMAYFRNIAVTTAIIPESVDEIGVCAFTDCRSLSAVSLPQSIKHIGAMAFAMCGSLRSVYVRNTDPSQINVSPDAFSGIDPEKCTLYIPAGSRQAYESSKAWSSFGIISEYDTLAQQHIIWDTEYDISGEGHVTVTLDAIASSGLPVTYRLSPESAAFATITGDRLTLPTDMKITVTATQDGGSGFLPADAVTRTIHAVDGIDSPVADTSVRVYSIPGKIIITNAREDDVARIHDMAGHTVYSGKSRSVSVPAGHIYIVNINGHTFKILVK